MRVLVELDSVFCNFNAGAAQLFNLPYIPGRVYFPTWAFGHVDVDRFYTTIEAHPGFWLNLNPFPWFSDLVQLLDLYASDWHLLVVCPLHSRAWSERAAWVRTYFGDRGLYRSLMVAQRPAHLAAECDLLITASDPKTWAFAYKQLFHWTEYSDFECEAQVSAQLSALSKVLGGNISSQDIS